MENVLSQIFDCFKRWGVEWMWVLGVSAPLLAWCLYWLPRHGTKHRPAVFWSVAVGLLLVAWAFGRWFSQYLTAPL